MNACMQIITYMCKVRAEPSCQFASLSIYEFDSALKMNFLWPTLTSFVYNITVFYLEECCVHFLANLSETADSRSAVSQQQALSTVGVWKIWSWQSSPSFAGLLNTRLCVSSLSKCNYVTLLKGTSGQGQNDVWLFHFCWEKKMKKMPLSFVVKSSSVRPEFQNAHVH